MDFNFSLSGYPLTFFTMFAVSLTVNTLTATHKRQERIRMEAETERMRANLLRAISHDLRTPLTAISGSAITLLENDNLPDWQKKKLLGSINDDAEWLIRMVENLLSVTRIGLEAARIENSYRKHRYTSHESYFLTSEDFIYIKINNRKLKKIV